MTDAVEDRHSTHEIHAAAGSCESDIDEPKASCGVLNLRTELIDRQACHLGTEHLDIARLDARQQGEREDHYTQAAYPLRETAPQQDAVGLAVDIGEHSAACSGETRHGLKESIAQRGAGAVDEIGH